MILLGDKFCTFMDRIDGVDAVIKAQDMRIPGRDSVRCFREYLGYCLGVGVGLAMIDTRLIRHPHYGRISAQQFVCTAQRISRADRLALATETVGFKIMLLDLVCGNHDRRRDNILTANGTVFPIDFNVAFGFRRPLMFAEFNTMVMRWFGLDGTLALQASDRVRLTSEISQLEDRLNESYLRSCLDAIHPAFLAVHEKRSLLEHLIQRLRLVRPAFEHWWETTITPLFKWNNSPIVAS